MIDLGTFSTSSNEIVLPEAVEARYVRLTIAEVDTMDNLEDNSDWSVGLTR